MTVLNSPAPAQDVQQTRSSEGYQAGAAAKRCGLPQMPPREIPGDFRAQLRYELDWLDGWNETDVVFEQSRKNIVQAVSVMSDDQIARECVRFKKMWYVALKPGSDELAWLHAITREERRRSAAAAPRENVRVSFAMA